MVIVACSSRRLARAAADIPPATPPTTTMRLLVAIARTKFRGSWDIMRIESIFCLLQSGLKIMTQVTNSCQMVTDVGAVGVSWCSVKTGIKTNHDFISIYTNYYALFTVSFGNMKKSEGVEPLELRTFRISEHFSPINAAAGGLAIGTVAVSRLMLWGKITGISGILAGIINKPSPLDWAARLAFAGGMVSCGSAMQVPYFV
jgi:hypothetical protein